MTRNKNNNTAATRLYICCLVDIVWWATPLVKLTCPRPKTPQLTP